MNYTESHFQVNIIRGTKLEDFSLLVHKGKFHDYSNYSILCCITQLYAVIHIYIFFCFLFF